MDPTPAFKIFSSLRYDTNLPEKVSELQDNDIRIGPLYMFAYHRDRLLEAARHFQWPSCIAKLEGKQGLSWLRDEIESIKPDIGKKACCRTRVTLDVHGNVEVEMMPTPRLSPDNLFPTREVFDSHLHTTADDTDEKLGVIWTIFLDSEPTEKSPFTLYKTTSRHVYTAARNRTGILSFTSPEEVLMHNLDGEVMEASLTSVYIYRNGQWITPNRQSGGQLGVTRRWALEQDLCTEGTVKIDDLVEGENMWISNGVRGFIRARYRSSRPREEIDANFKVISGSNGMVNMNGGLAIDEHKASAANQEAGR